MKQRFHTFFKKINTTISAHHWKRTLVAFPVCVALLAPAAWAASNSTDEAAEQDTTETAVVEQPSTDFFVSQLGNVPPPTVGAKEIGRASCRASGVQTGCGGYVLDMW